MSDHRCLLAMYWNWQNPITGYW